MKGLYTNNDNEVVYLGSRKPEDPEGLTWYDVSSNNWPEGGLVNQGLRKWAYVDNEFELANVEEIRASEERATRDRLLKSTDACVLPDHPDNSQAIIDYRKALRDVPSQAGFPFDIAWPEKP